MRTIVCVLRSGGDFAYKDVELLARHIFGKWHGADKPRIICLWDGMSIPTCVSGVLFLPLQNDFPGTWSRMDLYSPELEKYRPFLYVDLDTAIVNSIENIFDLVEDQSQFIVLEDFYQKKQLATGIVWFPAKSEKISNVWKARDKARVGSFRMDYFLREVITPDAFWQDLTDSICDFKPQNSVLLSTLPKSANLVCLHGKPRMFQAAETIPWVYDYVHQMHFHDQSKKITVIIPYKVDRGWLNEAIDSVPKNVQLLVSQGDGNWPANFNKALSQATGDYIKFLHEDDMLTPESLFIAANAMDEQGVDFIHGNAYEIYMNAGRTLNKYVPTIKNPTIAELLTKNVIHSATLMYRRKIFDSIGGFDESLWSQEEFEFNLRCLKNGFKLGYCNSFLAYYRRHPAQKVRTVPVVEIKNEKQMVRNKYAI